MTEDATFLKIQAFINHFPVSYWKLSHTSNTGCDFGEEISGKSFLVCLTKAQHGNNAIMVLSAPTHLGLFFPLCFISQELLWCCRTVIPEDYRGISWSKHRAPMLSVGYTHFKLSEALCISHSQGLIWQKNTKLSNKGSCHLRNLIFFFFNPNLCLHDTWFTAQEVVFV